MPWVDELATEDSALLSSKTAGGGTFSIRTPLHAAGGLSIDREVLTTALAFRVRRFRQCRSLPLSVGAYAFFIAAILLHAKVPTAYDVEMGIQSSLISSSAFGDTVGDATTWYAWARDSLIPLAMGTDLPADASVWPVRYLNGYSVALGGLRFAQARSVSVSCAEDSALSAIDGSQCFPSVSLSTASYGAPTPDVASAFSPGPPRGLETLQEIAFPFEQIINVGDSTASSGQAIVDSLQNSTWIDGATRAVTTTLILYNGQISTWAVVRWTVDFMRGGRTALYSHVVSFPADPYVKPPDQLAPATDGFGGSDGTAVAASFLEFVDVLVIVYATYLLLGTIRRVSKIFIHLREKSLGEKIMHGLTYWLIIDYTTIVSLFVLIGYWSSFVAKAAAIRKRLAQETLRVPASYGGATHADTAASIVALGGIWESFKVSAVVALILLSLRLFKYFQFQPRLNVMTQSIATALTDIAHFALLFAVLLACYGTWGIFMFGAQAHDFATVNESIVSVFRYMMYDYDRDAMLLSFPDMANLYFGSFMIIMTNLTLWMFFAIILENFTDVRLSAKGSPTLYDDAVAFMTSLPPAATWFNYLTCGLSGRRPAGIEDVYKELDEASHQLPQRIEPSTLVKAIPFLQHSAAEAIIVDALAWANAPGAQRLHAEAVDHEAIGQPAATMPKPSISLASYAETRSAFASQLAREKSSFTGKVVDSRVSRILAEDA